MSTGVLSQLGSNAGGFRWSADLRYSRTGQPTGRPAFPGFVARSLAHPETELRNTARWMQSWDDARTRILRGEYVGRMFEDSRWIGQTVC